MPENNPIRILLADDHEIFRDGFRAMIRKQPDVVIAGEAGDGEELVRIATELDPDVVVTDIKMPRMDGIAATRQLLSVRPGLGIIALSMFDEEQQIVEMLEAGAKGYLLKNAHKKEIVAAIKSVYGNIPYYCEETSARLATMIGKSQHRGAAAHPTAEFSEKEIEVMQCICKEMMNKEIAAALHLSVRTIEGYRERIQEKTGARNAAGIVIYAIRHGIYQVE